MKTKKSLVFLFSFVFATAMVTACKNSSSGSESTTLAVNTTEAETTTVTEAVKEYKVPKLLGRTEEEVKKELEGVKIAVSRSYDEDYPAGQIFKANVQEGDTIYSGQNMTIYISLGHDYGLDVIGMTGDEAKSYLESNGVKVGSVSKGNMTEDPELVGKVYKCSYMGDKALLDVYDGEITVSENTSESGENEEQNAPQDSETAE